MEARLNGPDRPAEPLGDRSESQVRPVMEHDDGPLVRIKGREPAQGFIPFQHRPERVTGLDEPGRPVERDEADPATTPEAVAADVDEDPIEPRPEPGWVAERPERSPGANECVLGGVLRIVPVAEDEASQPVGAVELAPGGAQEALLDDRATRVGQESLPCP